MAYSNYCGFTGYSHPRFKEWYKHYLAVAADSAFAWLHTYVFHSFLGLSALLLNKDIISPELIRYYNEQGVRVMAWTVNNPKEKMFFRDVLKITYLTDTLET